MKSINDTPVMTARPFTDNETCPITQALVALVKPWIDSPLPNLETPRIDNDELVCTKFMTEALDPLRINDLILIELPISTC
jgi:hypothetical protein